MNKITKRIGVLVVDESLLMRTVVASIITKDPDMEVVGTACDSRDAIAKIQHLKPDIVTMDIGIGLASLKYIMENMPLPVLIFSSLNNENVDSTLEALDLGAVDFICKDTQLHGANIKKTAQMLTARIKEIIAKKKT